MTLPSAYASAVPSANDSANCASRRSRRLKPSGNGNGRNGDEPVRRQPSKHADARREREQLLQAAANVYQHYYNDERVWLWLWLLEEVDALWARARSKSIYAHM